MAETRRQRKLQAYLRKQYPGVWLFKVHGGPFQPAGLPDLIGCLPGGRFFGFEVKEPKGEATDLQLETLADIRAAGGIAAVVVTTKDLDRAINGHLRKAR